MRSVPKDYAEAETTSNRSAEGPALDWRKAFRVLEGAYSANTIRAYKADFTIFAAWCDSRNQPSLPASPKTVADFLRDQSTSAKSATISRRRAAISRVHRLLKLANPAPDEDVHLAARTIYRQKGRRQDQVLGLTVPLKKKIVEACPDDLRGLRDRALISMGYDTLCRRSELVQLRVEDLVVEPDGSGTILIRRAKADQFGNGRLAYLSTGTVAYTRHWLEASDINEGRVFRAVTADETLLSALASEAVARIIKARAKRAGLDATQVAHLSGHSMRVGAAQDMAAAGIELVAIMHAGGWKSPEMVMRYIEHMAVQKSGMARMYAVKR
jgi:site-specific recombinase XerD